MAQQTSVTLVDDLDGGKAVETVAFGIDGALYEIDLSKKNADTLRKAIAGFVEHGRRVKPIPKTTRSSRKGGDLPAAADVREWAVGAGVAVSTRGRVPADVIAQYEAAHR